MDNLESCGDVVAVMPKVELHAHLNGSISEQLLKHLKTFGENDVLKEPLQQNTTVFPDMDDGGVLMASVALPTNASINEESNRTRSLKECWDAFSKIHEVIRTTRILYVATLNVIAEFARDNVVYAEIRTSPKKIHNIPSKATYLETVIKAIQDCRARFPISVKLLISIDRKNGEADAFETVKLANEIRKNCSDVVGVDVSGDPRCGHANWIVRVMQEARNNGLKISCHLPEIINPDEGLAFMEFGPERVGHGQFLHSLYGGTEQLWGKVLQKRIPIECCISSNLVSGVCKSIETHIVKILHEEALPFVICTDDSGVFKTSLSIEYKKMLSLIPLSLKQLYDLSIQAVQFSFASQQEKSILTNLMKEWWVKNLRLQY